MRILLPGAVLGYRSNGAPILLVAGGATENFDAWIPVEYDSNVVQKVTQKSAVEAVGQLITMTTNTRSIPRDSGSDIDLTAKGGQYGEDTNPNDSITLINQKFTRSYRLAEEDMNDSLANTLNSKRNAFGTAFAKAYDNACLAVTSAKSVSGCAFDSLYYLLTQSDTNTGYTANANITSVSGPAYADYNTAVGIYENGDYWSEDDTVVIAHPNFRKALRGIVGTDGRPIFVESTAGFPGGGGPTPARLFDYPIKWSLGCRLNATVSAKPTGHPIMVICNSMYIYRGVRTTQPTNPSGTPEFQVIPASISQTDEALMKARARRAFAPGVEQAFSVLVDTSL